MTRGAKKPVQDTADLCNRAADMLRGAGFVLHTASRKTEACYYHLPGRNELLRVATHTSNGRTMGLGKVVSKITFGNDASERPGTLRISNEKVESLVAGAIGRYMIQSAKP